MPEQFINPSMFAELGVAGVAIVFIYLAVRMMSKRHAEEAKMYVEMLDRRDKAFRDYVSTQNHRSTELIIKSTRAIEQATETIKETGVVVTGASAVLKEVRDYFIREGLKK